jgi:hypothetical protein
VARSRPGGRPLGGRIAARTISGWARRVRSSAGGLATARVESAGDAVTGPRVRPGDIGVSSTARSGSTTTTRVGVGIGRTVDGAVRRVARSSASGGGAGAGTVVGAATAPAVGTIPVRGTAAGSGSATAGAGGPGRAAEATVVAGRPMAVGCRSMVSRNG